MLMNVERNMLVRTKIALILLQKSCLQERKESTSSIRSYISFEMILRVIISRDLNLSRQRQVFTFFLSHLLYFTFFNTCQFYIFLRQMSHRRHCIRSLT